MLELRNSDFAGEKETDLESNSDHASVCIYILQFHFHFSWFRLCAAYECLKHLIVFLTLVTL
jgi:hypothetical protein